MALLTGRPLSSKSRAIPTLTESTRPSAHRRRLSFRSFTRSHSWDELLAAVDVVRRAGERRVGHDPPAGWRRTMISPRSAFNARDAGATVGDDGDVFHGPAPRCRATLSSSQYLRIVYTASPVIGLIRSGVALVGRHVRQLDPDRVDRDRNLLANRVARVRYAEVPALDRGRGVCARTAPFGGRPLDAEDHRARRPPQRQVAGHLPKVAAGLPDSRGPASDGRV